MIIIDLSQVMHATIAAMSRDKNVVLDEGMFRHIVLNIIRANKVKFKDYGDIVIAVDSSSWRKGFFPYYKYRRGIGRSESTLDWSKIFDWMNTVREELKEFFPYRVIKVDKAEADDIIGTLAHRFGQELGGDPILIVSGDKDFRQLQVYGNVHQWDPVNKKFVKEKDPEGYLLEHILLGDSGDDVPNILSDNDVFVDANKRQKPMRKERIEELNAQYKTGELQKTANFIRNSTLVDLSRTPDEIKAAINAEFDSQAGKTRSKIFNYFIEKRLKHLLESINEF